MSTLAAPALVVREGAGGPALPLAPVRALVLLALAVFGGLHWMRMFDPAEPSRAWEAAAIAAIVIVALLGAARLPWLLRPLAAGAIAVGGFALALLAGGVADEELRPERWSSLLGRIGRGLEALPGVNVPVPRRRRGHDARPRRRRHGDRGGGGGARLLAARRTGRPASGPRR